MKYTITQSTLAQQYGAIHLFKKTYLEEYIYMHFNETYF